MNAAVLAGGIVAGVLILVCTTAIVAALTSQAATARSDLSANAEIDDLDRHVARRMEVPEARLSVVERLRESFEKSIGAWIERAPQVGALQGRLNRADLKMRSYEWIGIVALVALASAALVGARLDNVIGALVGLIIGVMGCETYLRVRINRRRVLFDEQLIDVLIQFGAALRGGIGLTDAMRRAAESAPDPCGTEFRRVVDTIPTASLQAAMKNMVIRTQSEEVAILAVALGVQEEVGSELGGVLRNLRDLIRMRVRVRSRVHVLTSQARMSGYVLSALPFVLTAILVGVAPSYFAPLVTTSLGRILIGVGLLGEIVGASLMRRLSRVDF